MRLSLLSETTSLASLPVSPDASMSSLCFCAYLEATLEVEGLRELFLQGPICLQSSNDPYANSLPQT